METDSAEIPIETGASDSKSLPATIRKKITEKVAEIIATALMGILIAASALYADRIFDTALRLLGKRWLLLVVFLSPCLAAYFCWKWKSAKAHHFSDDYEFQPRLGLYRHKAKTGYFCGSCTPKGIVSPLHEMEHGWQCQIKGCEKFHKNPDYKAPPSQPFPLSRIPHFEPRRLRPEDF